MAAKQWYGFVLLCIILTEATDPCDNDGHRRVPNEGFRYVNFKLTGDEKKTPNHDSRLLEGWYYVGNTKMPESPPDKIFSCGTKFPIWLNGTHPTDTKEHACPKCACMKGLLNNCSKRYDIKIKHCPKPKGFYLYHLKPTADITEGYCFGVGKNGSATTHVSSKPKLTFPLKSMFVGGYPVTRVRFHCDFTASTAESLYYRVSWWRNDDLWYNTPYATDSSKDELLLTESIFHQKGFRLGQNVSCTVRAFVVEDGPPGRESPRSEVKFVGIEVLTPELIFQNGETDTSKKTIKLKPTVPVGCTAEPTCHLWLTVYTNVSADYEKCSGLVLKKTSCGANIDSQTYDKELHIPIDTQETGQYQTDIDIYFVYLKTDDTNNNILWKNYHLPPIKVMVTPKPTQTYQGKKCFAHSDPHMTTFDGKYYENHQTGVFTLYKHTPFDAEIQIQHENCNPHGGIAIQCPCGVAARAGQDSYVIDFCGGKIEFGYKTCGDHAVIAKSTDSSHYKIILPHGTYVDVTVLYKPFAGRNEPDRVLHVDVIPSIYDENSASMGLCGRLDGDCLNDFHYRDGTATKNYCLYTLGYNNQPVDFIKAWKVTSKFENMFLPNFNETNQATPRSNNLCGCDAAHNTGGRQISNIVQCQQNTVATCTKSRGKVIDGQCMDHTRHRRSLRGNHVVPTVYIPRSVMTSRTKRAQDSNKTWTEPDAKDYCDKYMKRSPIFEDCGKVPNAKTDFSVDTCVSDILLTGGPNWASMSMEGMRGSCLSELERNTTLRETNKNSSQPSLAQRIEEKACPNNCSEAGKCSKGKCHCEAGFGSSDCSLDMSKAPTLSGLLDHGLCDEQQLKCDHAYMFGHIFSDVGNLTCKLEEFSISTDGTRTQGSTHHLPGEFETLIEVICPLHTVRRKRSTRGSGEHREFVFGYSISVSNDGNHFQNEGHDLFVYDSACQLVTNISGQMHFTLKDGYCFIENRCVPDGNNSVSNKCSVCKSNTSTAAWSTEFSIAGCTSGSTQKKSTEKIKTDKINTEKMDTESKKTKYLWVIGVVGGVIVGAVVAGVVFVKLTTRRAKKVGDSTLLRSHVDTDGQTPHDKPS